MADVTAEAGTPGVAARKAKAAPLILVCGGIPRSGSTWLYNALRLWGGHEHPDDHAAMWVDALSPEKMAAVTVVKMHDAAGLSRLPDGVRTICFTSHRDLRDIARSLIDMGWNTEENVIDRLVEVVRDHDDWRARSIYDMKYEAMTEAPLAVLEEVMRHLPGGGAGLDLAALAESLGQLPDGQREQGHDPVTLMHPGHRRDGRHGSFQRLPPALLGDIEARFGDWLRLYGYAPSVEPGPAPSAGPGWREERAGLLGKIAGLTAELEAKEALLQAELDVRRRDEAHEKQLATLREQLAAIDERMPEEDAAAAVAELARQRQAKDAERTAELAARFEAAAERAAAQEKQLAARFEAAAEHAAAQEKQIASLRGQVSRLGGRLKEIADETARMREFHMELAGLREQQAGGHRELVEEVKRLGELQPKPGRWKDRAVRLSGGMRSRARPLAPRNLARKALFSAIRIDLENFYQYPPRPLRIPESYGQVSPPRPAPRISIVTPSFNSAPFIEATLRSVLDQDYPDLQYICQDGASQDGTAAILKRHADRLHDWRSEPDDGQTQAINRGFSRADGEILAYLNSDDLLLPGALAYVARYFAAHPEIDVVYGHRIIVDGAGDEIGRWIVPPHNAEVIKYADYIPQETMFWRRRIWERVGGSLDESFRFAMDWDLILRFQDAGARFARLSRFLGAFRAHEEQKSQAEIASTGVEEMNRLRHRSLGYLPDHVEIGRRIRNYRLHHGALTTWWHMINR